MTLGGSAVGMLGPVGGPTPASSAMSAVLGEPLGPPHGVRLAGEQSLAASVGLPDVLEGVVDPPAVVSIAETARLVGGDDAHWFGSWVADEMLYWFLLLPDASLTTGTVAFAEIKGLLEELGAALPDLQVGDDGQGEDVVAFTLRLARSALADPEREADLARRMGHLLIPEELRELLAAADTDLPLSLVVAPAPEIASVPFAWLAFDDEDTRVLERAVVRLGASIGLLHEAGARRPAGPGGASLGVIDPAGDLLGGNDNAPAPTDVALDLKGHGCTRVLAARCHHQALGGVLGATRVGRARREDLASELQAARPRRLFYLGHARSGAIPADAALQLEPVGGHEPEQVDACDAATTFGDDTGSAGALLSARALFLEDAWPMADRVVLIACGGARQGGREWLGLAPAALYAGAQVVIAGLWDLVWQPAADIPSPFPTYDLARQAFEAADAADPAVAWRAVQRSSLTSWRTTHNQRFAPLYWAGIATIGFIPA